MPIFSSMLISLDVWSFSKIWNKERTKGINPLIFLWWRGAFMLALCRGPRDGGGELALRSGRVGTYSQMSEEGWGGWEVTVNYPWPRDLASNYIWIPSSNLFWTCVGSLKPVYGLLCLFWTCVWFIETCVWFTLFVLNLCMVHFVKEAILYLPFFWAKDGHFMHCVFFY